MDNSSISGCENAKLLSYTYAEHTPGDGGGANDVADKNVGPR